MRAGRSGRRSGRLREQSGERQPATSGRELGGARLVGAVEDRLDRKRAQLLRQNLDTPRAGVAGFAHRGDVLADRELAFSGQLAVVDRLVDGVVHVLPLPVGELDPAEVPRGCGAERVRADPELRHVPGVDREAAVGGVRSLDESQRGVEVVDVHVGRHELVDDAGVVMLGGVGAQLGEPLDQRVQVAGHAGDVPDLDVVCRERRGRLPEPRPQLVGGSAALVVRVEEPVGEELELEVAQAVVVEQLRDLTQCSCLENVLEIGVPEADPAEADAGGLDAAIFEIEEAPLPSVVRLRGAGRRPVEPEQFVGGHARNVTVWQVPCSRLVWTRWRPTT